MPYFVVASKALVSQTDLISFSSMMVPYSELFINGMAQLHPQPIV
jgi:hypothetical protein